MTSEDGQLGENHSIIVVFLLSLLVVNHLSLLLHLRPMRSLHIHSSICPAIVKLLIVVVVPVFFVCI